MVIDSANCHRCVTLIKEIFLQSEKNSFQIVQVSESIAKLEIEGVEKGSQYSTLQVLLAYLAKEQVEFQLCSSSNNVSAVLLDSIDLVKVVGAVSTQFTLTEYYANICQEA
jgi:aspartokinase